MMALCEMYEQALKIQFPDLGEVQYNVNDISRFVEELYACTCMLRSGKGGVMYEATM